MINLLPLEYKKRINKEIMERVLNAAALLFSLVFVLGIVVSVPSIIYLNSQIKSSKDELSGVMLAFGAESDKSASTLITERNELLEYFFDKDQIPLYPTKAFEPIINEAGEGIKLSTLIYKPETKSGDSKNAKEITYKVGVSGVSSTRDGLIEYRKRLEQIDEIAKVELPISSLVENSDIDFSITITYK